MSAQLTPHFGNVQAHYDLSDDFFRLFLDPSQTYSCAYFERDDMTLHEAQLAKIDLSLSKLKLEPGMTLLDIGCGWGATMRRALQKYDVNVVGLTLSENQAEHVQKSFDDLHSHRSARVLLEGWEKFDEPVDRIVSIGAFEHFGRSRWNHFFRMAYRVLPHDGIMMLHTITRPTFKDARARGVTLTHEIVHFTQFILAEIFPGGWLPTVQGVEEHGVAAGFRVTKVQSLQLHYARTLDMWAEALEANKDEAIAIQSREVYDRYMKYLTGCADLFRKGVTDVDQYTMEK
jgi:cyclopropane-fatty-acyl-phospholipid synthase